MTLAAAACLALSACGGGGSDSDSAPVNPGNGGGVTNTSISGVAAVGLPLVGTVTVKDALGATKTVTIGSLGAYTVDVSGMTAPFVFRAEGSVGGREYVVHSAGVSSDVGGTINITPLTDLVLSNVAGQIASQYFESNSFANVTAAKLQEEAQALQQKLLPVLQALGVDASTDLLRTPFTPLASALDAALDVLRVDYNAGVASITNVVTNQRIEDDLAKSAAQDAPVVMDQTAGVASADDDIAAIRAAVKAFGDKFATQSPSAATLKTSLSADFLFRDTNADDFIAELSGFAPIVGSAFTELTVERVDYTTNPSRPVAYVRFVLRSKDGNLISNENHWQLVKDNGSWRLHGDQRTFDVEANAFMYNGVNAATGTTTCRQSGLSLSVEDRNPANSAGVAYFIVTGPGVPGAKLLKPEFDGDNYQIDTDTSNGGIGNYYVTASNCGGSFEIPNLASVPDNAVYTYTGYDANDVAVPGAVFTDVVEKRPLTLAELANSTLFPALTAQSLTAFKAYQTGSLSLTATGLDRLGLASYNLYVPGQIETEDEDVVKADGSFSSLLSTTGGARTGWFLDVESYRTDGRTFLTQYRP